MGGTGGVAPPVAPTNKKTKKTKVS